MDHYVDVETGQAHSLDDIRQTLPQSLIPDGADLAEFGFALLVEIAPPVRPDGCKIVRGVPAIVDGSWVIGWTVEPLTEQEQEAQRLMRVPRSIQRRQARLALRRAGLLSAVEAAIAAIEDEDERMDAQIEYEADTWERGNQFLKAMWLLLGGTERELDDLFVVASAL